MKLGDLTDHGRPLNNSDLTHFNTHVFDVESDIFTMTFDNFSKSILNRLFIIDTIFFIHTYQPGSGIGKIVNRRT